MLKYLNGNHKDKLVLSEEIYMLLSGMWTHPFLFTLILIATLGALWSLEASQ